MNCIALKTIVEQGDRWNDFFNNGDRVRDADFG